MDKIMTQTFKIVPTDSEIPVERYDPQIRALLASTLGTIPGSRGYGLARTFLSAPMNEAVNILAIELEEKVEEYIPEITIEEVVPNYGKRGGIEGAVESVSIVIGIREGYEEEEE